ALSVVLSLCFFVFYCYGDHRDLPSFPTRRSSDLGSSGSEPPGGSSLGGSSAGGSSAGGWTSAGAGGSPMSPCSRSRSEKPALARSEEHTSELQSRENLVCRLLLEKKKKKKKRRSK